MSVRKLNWLKFTGLVGLAFALGLLFAGLLNLPGTSLAQGGGRQNPPAQLAGQRTAAAEVPGARALVDLSDAFSSIAEHVRPSVVFITSERKQTASNQVPRGFEPFFPQQRNREPIIQRGSGSGFIVSNDGYILTNNHVVDGAQKVTVQLLDRRSFPARVVGTDPTTDVAVIKIEARSLTPVALGSSTTTRIGEWVLAIGNPLGANLTFTVTQGIVSAKGRGLPSLPGRSELSIQDFIQTDATINPGNSGGPLVNVRGEVIGINSAIASETGYSQGYGFAIPIDLARNVMDQLIKNGKVERAALGVIVTEADANDAQYVGLPDIRGVRITRFSGENSPAKAAGVEQGDIVITVDGQAVETVAQLQQVVGFKHPGETVKVEVARKGGVRRTYSVRLTTVPTSTEIAAQDDSTPNRSNPGDTSPTASIQPLGIKVTPLTPEIASELRLPSSVRGLVVQEVDRDGPAGEALLGTESGSPDVILRVEGQPVRTEAELRAALRQPGPGRIVTMIVYNAQAQERVVRVAIK